MRGIYCYEDLNTNQIVYIGKDSYIDTNKRKYAHSSPSMYSAQLFNKILQNSPKRYKYKILKQGNFSQNLLNALEILYIKRYSPRFNFTKGGDGKFGFKPSKDTIKKISHTQNTTGYYRVSKVKDSHCKQGFRWRYSYYDDSKKRMKISSVDLDELEKKVKSKGLEWYKFEKEFGGED